MPKLSEVANKRVERDFDIRGVKLHVVYDPDCFTPKLESELQKAEQGEQGRVFAEMMATMVLEWDLTDEKNKVLKTDFETMFSLPTALLGDIASAIGESLTGEVRDEGKDSPAT